MDNFWIEEFQRRTGSRLQKLFAAELTEPPDLDQRLMKLLRDVERSRNRAPAPKRKNPNDFASGDRS